MEDRKYDYDYKRNGDILEIIIRDSSHRKIEEFRCNLSDKKLCRKFFSVIQDKYGILEQIEDPKIKSSNSWINENDTLS